MTMRQRPVIVAFAGALIVAIAAGGVFWLGFGRADEPSATSFEFDTTEVASGDIVQDSAQQGTLAFSDAQQIIARRVGTVTALPSEAAVITPGIALYAVDTQPTILLRGTLPAWRDFSRGMSDGDDVQQLEQNLHDLGIFNGDIDRTFTNATAESVELWQRKLNVEATGELPASSIIFSPTDVRVSALAVQIGTPVGDGTPIYTGTSTAKIVTVDLRLEDQQLAVPAGAVTVTLSDGTEMSATITSVGQPRQTPATGAGASATDVVPVTITPTDQATTGPFARANVTVHFPRATVQNALTVPVDALIATGASQFAVQVPGAGGTATNVPVTLGVFQAGRVQVSGEGIVAGMTVIVP